MPSQPVAAIIFDFDGVLADTERLHLTAFQAVFAARGWQLDESVYFARYLGYDDRGLVVTFAADQELSLTADDVQTLVREKTESFDRFLHDGSVLFPQAGRCLDRMASHFTLAIASGAAKAEIFSILDGAGLRDRFTTIVAADDVSETKPSPEPYLTAARQLGVAPGACVAVEDSTPGLAAARAAGMRAIGITTTLPRGLLTDAHRVIDELDELSPEFVLAL